MFGGGSGSDFYSLDDQELFNDLWILSLPSFRWIRKVFTDPGVPAPRQQHTCHSIGMNMLILGGATNTTGTCAWDEMSFMDMTTLTFSTVYSYNPNQYVLPDIVKAATFTNGQPQQDPANGWDDDELEKLFKGHDNDDHKPANHLAAIIGGIVGGVVLIGIAVIAFFLLRRYRQKRGIQRQPQLPPVPNIGTAYLGHELNVGEGGGRSPNFYPESNRVSHYSESTYSLQSPQPLSAYSHIDHFGGGEKGQSQNTPLIAPSQAPYFELANVEPYRNVGDESIRRPVRQQTTRYELGGI